MSKIIWSRKLRTVYSSKEKSQGYGDRILLVEISSWYKDQCPMTPTISVTQKDELDRKSEAIFLELDQAVWLSEELSQAIKAAKKHKKLFGGFLKKNN